MKRMMNAGALGLGSMLLLAITACSSADTPATDGSPSPPAGSSKHTPKLSVVRTPGSQLASLKGITLGAKSGGGALGGNKIRSGGAPGTCGFTSGDATCDACITGSCCTEDAACNGDAECNALVACFDACTDDACFSTCQTTHAAGMTKLGTFLSCLDTSCRTDCGGPPPEDPRGGGGGGVCGGVTSGDAACDACLGTTCCGDVTACIDDADCRDFMSCLEGCGDTKCENACQATHPAGAAELGALSTCVSDNCAACGGGSAPPPPPPPPPGTPASCGLSSGLSTCDACINTACCTQSSACVGDADCVAFLDCLNACGDEVCANACAASHASGAAKLGDVVTCLDSSCSASCN